MTLKGKTVYILTGLLLLSAVLMRTFASYKADAVTIQPAAVEEDITDTQLTKVEQKYVDDFVKRVNRERKLTPTGYEVERLTNSEVNIDVMFKETKDVGHVRYDPWLDRWSGNLTLSGEG